MSDTFNEYAEVKRIYDQIPREIKQPIKDLILEMSEGKEVVDSKKMSAEILKDTPSGEWKRMSGGWARQCTGIAIREVLEFELGWPSEVVGEGKAKKRLYYNPDF